MNDLEAISPELVLVAPAALAAEARAGLPDRPWESFLPAAPPPPPRIHAVPEHAAALPEPPPTSERRRPGSVLRTAAFALVSLGALFVFSTRPVPDAPTFVLETSADDAGGPAPTPSARSAPTAGAPSRPSQPPDRSAPGQVRRAVPFGGYIFAGGGTIVIGARGAAIERFEAVTSCAERIRLKQIPLSRDGTFVARREFKHNGKATLVRVSGRVVSRDLIRGEVTTARGRCLGNRHFSARLS